MTRRDLIATICMAAGLTVSYGVLGLQGLLFLLPKRVKPHTRRLFAGRIEQYENGKVQSFYDLRGNEILVKRDDSNLRAFDATCPHLGCRVHWEEKKQAFFCPCHRGVFDANGVAISGPPAAAGQRLSTVPVERDERGGVVYIDVKDVRKRRI